MKSDHKYSSPEEANAKNNMDIEDPQKAPSQRSISTKNIVIGIIIVAMSIIIITIAIVFSKENEQIDTVIIGKTLKFRRTNVDGGNVYKFVPQWVPKQLSDRIITFDVFLQKIETDDEFLNDFLGILKNGTDFNEYRIEFAPTSRDTYGKTANPFEFILMKSDASRQNNQQLTKPSDCNSKKIEDINIRIKDEQFDSTLIFPCPQSSNDAKYANLATFVRNSPEDVIRNKVFQKAADQLFENLQNETMSQAKWYLSSAVTSGDKIKNWIHFRVDPSPKFYQYKPYKT